MKLTRFPPDKWFWISASLTLFVLTFCIPWVPAFFPYDSPLISPVRLLRQMLDYNQSLQTKTHRFDERDLDGWDYLRSTYFLFSPAVFSVLFGWVLQCSVVMVQDANYNRRNRQP
jgi:hypothetical protein